MSQKEEHRDRKSSDGTPTQPKGRSSKSRSVNAHSKQKAPLGEDATKPVAEGVQQQTAALQEKGVTHSLEEVAQAGEIVNKNMARQNAITYQQSVYQMSLASIAKCFEMITRVNPESTMAQEQINTYQALIEQFSQMAKDAGSTAMNGSKPVGMEFELDDSKESEP